MSTLTRRQFIQCAGSAVAATACAPREPLLARAAFMQPLFEVLHPRNRVPLSFIVDDSTCLVNMGYFCMPQFAQAWPQREEYKKPWKTWPREIPDSFVREFGEWCAERGVKGKYSIVPYPACVGWLDRDLPGWSRDELRESLALVRDLMVPNWDIHPEMITHTRVIDIKTGRPMEPASDATMENSFPQTNISVDELASYLAFALKVLKNCDLPCEGITTPGGFGNRVSEKLPLAVHQAVRAVYGTELPHYFKYVVEGDESAAPKLEFLGGKRDVSELAMNIPAGTGDWFGGWDGDDTPQPLRYSNADATSGRMVELIERNQPAIMLCHWPGMYCQGTKQGFFDFQRVVTALQGRFAKRTLWMKLSEIGRYWAAREMTTIAPAEARVLSMDAPISCADFTVRVRTEGAGAVALHFADSVAPLRRVSSPDLLTADTFFSGNEHVIACFNLPKEKSRLVF